MTVVEVGTSSLGLATKEHILDKKRTEERSAGEITWKNGDSVSGGNCSPGHFTSPLALKQRTDRRQRRSFLDFIILLENNTLADISSVIESMGLLKM